MSSLKHATRHFIAWSAAIGALAFLTATFIGPARAAAPEVRAQLSPQQIGLDQAAQLSITVPGEQDAPPTVPSVAGLQITPTGQSSSYQSVNGAISASITHLYAITATRPGTYTVPSMAVGGSSTAPLVLRVTAAGANGGAFSAAAVAAAGGSAPQPQSSAIAGTRSAFVRVSLPKHSLYVGEAIPIEFKAYVGQEVDADLDGPPTLSSDAFTVSRLSDKPQQTTERAGGVTYTVLTWKAVLGAVKAGDYSFELELPLTQRVTVRPTQDDLGESLESFFGNDPFGSSFPDLSSMLGRVVEKSVTLKSGAASIEVMPLPTQDRPADFSGAVGRFQVASAVTPATGAAGDPLTLKLTISGEGNFDRVNTAGLTGSPLWRVYRTEVQPNPADDASLQGPKTFEQAIVPLQSGAVRVPALAFSYFDPQTRRYMTEHSRPITLAVTPGAVTAAGPSAPSSASAALAAPAPRANGLYPNTTPSGPFVSSLRPVVTAPWFMAATASPLLLLAGAMGLGRRRDAAAAWRLHAAESAELATYRTAMDAAQQRGDAAAFFIAARRALQVQLGRAWDLPPADVDEAMLLKRLAERSRRIRELFAHAEKAAYAQEVPRDEDLVRWRGVVDEELQRWRRL